MSKYLHVSPDKKEERRNVHAYVPRGLYRKLKLVHHDLIFYSMAHTEFPNPLPFYCKISIIELKLFIECKDDIFQLLHRPPGSL